MSAKPTMSCRAALAAVLLAAAGAVHAGATDDVQVHGFATQGWVTSSGNNINGESRGPYGTGELRELGVNASWRPLPALLLAGQTAAVEHGKATDEELALDYGVLDYAALSGKSGRLGLRAGKLKLPIGFYNDSRDAVFARPGVMLPESVYLENSGARSFGYFAADGGGLYGDWLAGDHALYFELIGATPQPLDDGAEIAILRATASGRFEVDRGLVGRIADDYDGGRWRAALSVLHTQLQYTDQNPNPLAPGNLFPTAAGFDFDQAVLSLQYNAERWSLTVEGVARHIELGDLNAFTPAPAFGPIKQDPVGYYVQGLYRITPAWQVVLRFDEQIRDIQDRHGTEQSALTDPDGPGPAQGLPRYYFFAEDWSAGTRYDLRSNVSVLAEYHYVDGAGWVNPLDNPDFAAGGADRYWTYLTLMLGIRF